MGCELGVRIPDDGLLVGWILDEQHGMDPQGRAERPADDRGVLHPRVVLEDRLHVLGVDLLAIGQGEHVLLPTAEGQHPVLGERAEIAGVVPALGVDGRRRGLRILPVAGEPAGPAGENLAVLGDPDFDARDRLADGADDVAVRPGEADDRPHLGRPVALQDIDAHVRPPSGDLDIEGRCPNADRVQLAAELAQHGAEQEALDRFGRPARQCVQSLERRAPAGLVHLALDGAVEQAQALRHDQEDGHAEVAECPDQHRRLAADGIDHTGADHQRRHEPEHLLVQM